MIHVVRGVYGHYINGKVVPKDKTSDPFELTPEQEERLVKLGIAEYVAPIEEPTEEEDTIEDDAPVGFDETPPAEDEAEKTLEEMTVQELREVGKEYGLTFKVGMTKAAMIEAIRAEDEASPEDDAPTFDAADAVVE